jgi:hypothetical protein
LLTLDDPGLAGQVVCDVIVDECVRSPAPAAHEHDASYRLAMSAYRRCQELADGHAWHSRNPRRRASWGLAACIDPCGLSARERGALALVVFGGLGYIQASRELAITPQEMAALLRAVLVCLTTPPGAAAGKAPSHGWRWARQ